MQTLVEITKNKLVYNVAIYEKVYEGSRSLIMYRFYATLSDAWKGIQEYFDNDDFTITDVWGTSHLASKQVEPVVDIFYIIEHGGEKK